MSLRELFDLPDDLLPQLRSLLDDLAARTKDELRAP